MKNLMAEIKALEFKLAGRETVQITGTMKDGTPVATVLGGKYVGSQVLLKGHKAKMWDKFEVETFRGGEGMLEARNIKKLEGVNQFKKG